MAERDVVVPAAYRVSDVSNSTPRACHLVAFKETDRFFIASERPTLEGSYIQTKGVFVLTDEKTVVRDWQKLYKELTEDKKNIVELYIPWLRVEYIRNLAYTAK